MTRAADNEWQGPTRVPNLSPNSALMAQTVCMTRSLLWPWSSSLFTVGLRPGPAVSEEPAVSVWCNTVLSTAEQRWHGTPPELTLTVTNCSSGSATACHISRSRRRSNGWAFSGNYEALFIQPCRIIILIAPNCIYCRLRNHIAFNYIQLTKTSEHITAGIKDYSWNETL